MANNDMGGSPRRMTEEEVREQHVAPLSLHQTGIRNTLARMARGTKHEKRLEGFWNGLAIAAPEPEPQPVDTESEHVVPLQPEKHKGTIMRMASGTKAEQKVDKLLDFLRL